jgi:hypothetical protein
MMPVLRRMTHLRYHETIYLPDISLYNTGVRFILVMGVIFPHFEKSVACHHPIKYKHSKNIYGKAFSRQPMIETY